MVTKRVIVESYNSEWKRDFEDIRSELMAVLDGKVISIEHVGSTSVEGLSAKPIIDIDVVIEDEDAFPEVKAAMESIGYTHEGDLGIPGREAFKYKGKEHLRKHHLYVCTKDPGLIAVFFRNAVVSALTGPPPCSPPGSSVHGDSPGKNTGLGCHALLHGIFPTQISHIASRFFTV